MSCSVEVHGTHGAGWPALSARVFAALACLLWTTGCERKVESQFVQSPGVAELDPPLRDAVNKELLDLCGMPDRPKLLGGDEKDAAHLLRGAEVYRRYCVQCHGVSGDGAGLAAEYLTPRPRDYRRGVFKFTSTPFGSKPRREDLVRTIMRGVVGTSMPSFRLLPKRDIEAVVDYVLALTHRGELEQMLAIQAEGEGELTKELVAEAVQGVLDRWREARDNVVEPATKMPPVTAESIAAGEAVFAKRECFKCHGRDGRGGLAGGIEVGLDAWGRKDPAADLTSGMLHGGQSPLDIYRRISSGINGTPMPAFRDSFPDEPEAIWHLTHFVLSLADKRRLGVQFAPGATAQAAAATPAAKGSPAEDSP